MVQSNKGDLIKNGGGIRKLPRAQCNKGKSGGIRAIYYWVTEDEQIFFLVAYPTKSVKDGLRDKETLILRFLVKERGRRYPTGPAATLIRILDAHPTLI